jgi:hypothetical protein
LEIPEYINRAFALVKYIDFEEDIKRFEQRWDGLDVPTLLRVLQQGQGEDKILAILALGYAGQSEVRDILLPLVVSGDPLERWASVIALGEMKEEQMRPLLEAMLTEKLPTGDEPAWLQAAPYDFWRMRIATILGEWQNPAVVPALRRAFIRIWEVAQRKRAGDKQLWFSFQDDLAYAMGRYGAFGALMGLNLPEYGLRLGVIYLACGYLNAKRSLLELQTNEALQEEIAVVLTEKFGFSESESESYVKMYGDSYFIRLQELNR